VKRKCSNSKLTVHREQRTRREGKYGVSFGKAGARQFFCG